MLIALAVLATVILDTPEMPTRVAQPIHRVEAVAAVTKCGMLVMTEERFIIIQHHRMLVFQNCITTCIIRPVTDMVINSTFAISL